MWLLIVTAVVTEARCVHVVNKLTTSWRTYCLLFQLRRRLSTNTERLQLLYVSDSHESLCASSAKHVRVARKCPADGVSYSAIHTNEHAHRQRSTRSQGIDWLFDRCHTCAILSCDKSCSTQLCMSHTVTFSHKQELTNLLGQCLFIRQSCSVRHAQLHNATFVAW